MPTYEYQCKACDHEFEREQRISDPPVKTCPSCKARQVKRLISRTSFHLKGGGWYSDLYSKPKGGAKSDGDSKSDSGATKSDSGKSDSASKSDSAAKPGAGSKKAASETPAKSDSGSGSGSGKDSGGSGSKAAA